MSPTTSDLIIKKSTTKEEEEEEQQPPKEEEQEEEEEKEEDREEKVDNLHRQEGDQRRLVVMSLHDVVQPPPLPPPPSPSPQSPSNHHLRNTILDDMSSPINVQIFDICSPDIFSETVQNNFDNNSSPNGCAFEDHSSSSYVANLSFPSIIVENDHDNSDNKFNIESLDISNLLRDQNDHNSTSTASSTATTANTTAATTNPSPFQNGLSIIFDSQDDMDDISASIDFSPSSPFSGPTPLYTINPITTTTTTQQDQYQIPLNNGISPHPASIESTTLLPFISGPPPPLGPVFEEDYLPPVLPFLRLNPANSCSPSCSSFLDHPSIGGSFLHGNLNHGLGLENSTVFSGSSFMGSELQPKELDFQGDSGGIFCPDQLPRVYNSGDKQAYSNEGSQLVSATTSSAPLATEITSVEDSSFKVGKLSTEQRKEKIHRYLKKRNERNFSKKIKYACRKTLADSRPRVRGRFAKNDDFVVTHRRVNGNHHDDDYDDVAMVKEEDGLMDSSDILSHISGVNSFKCNYQIQSWI